MARTLQSLDAIPDQRGRTFVITGANSGLGLVSTLALAAAGARVVMACRNPDKAAAAAEQVRSRTPDADLILRPLDLADLASVRAFADDLPNHVDRVDVLLNNAGIMAIPRRETADGFEMQLGTNHLGHFALTGRLLPFLEQGGPARVVTVASQAHRTGRMKWDDLMHTRGYQRWSVYGQSKLANLLFHHDLDRRLRAAGKPITAVAAHPGYAATNLQLVGAQMDGSTFLERFYGWANDLVAQSAEDGALPQLHAAVADDVQPGDYYGPNGFMEMWGPPKRTRGNARARDAVSQRALWERSVELTGEDFGGI